MCILAYDDDKRNKLLPLVYTRPCADLRVGILTLAEKWELISGHEVSFLTEDYLRQ